MTTTSASDRKLRLGVAGLGRAFSLMLPTFVADARIALVAAADPRPEARARFASEFSARAYATVAELCADPAVDAVYVATPHQHHAAHVQLAAAGGKHVLVEKPMALSLEACRAMVASADQAGVRLVVGHSHSFDRPIARARELVAAGTFGPVRMITALNYTDFLYRPRRPEELATEAGGGVFFNQAPHQVDVLRLLAGAPVASVRAGAGMWDRTRPTEGAYSAFLTFADGGFAALTYSGYGHFDSDVWCDGIGESGFPKQASAYGAARRALRQATGAEGEAVMKAARNYGGPAYAGAAAGAAARAPFHQHFGVVILSCDGADLRPTPKGVMIYGDDAIHFEPVPPPTVPRVEVIDELYDAVFRGRAPRHDGAWGLATMAVCFAMLQSARENREIAVP